MHSNNYNLNKYYKGVIQNRQVTFNQHNKEDSKLKFRIQSFNYSCILLLKLFLSIFYKKLVVPKRVGIDWSQYKYRFNDYDNNLYIIRYFYKKFNKEEFQLFKYVKVNEVYQLFNNLKPIKNLAKKNNYDNVFYRLVASIEFNMLKNFVIENQLEHIIIYGINDRYTIYLSEICKIENIKFTIIQHGALTKFEGCYTVYADEFMYMYEFSKPYLKYFITNFNNIKFLPCKKSQSNMNLKKYEKTQCNIAFACTPSNIELNFQIIEMIMKDLSLDVTLIVHPHPREDNNLYIEKLKNHSNIVVTKEKYKNIKFLVTRISSLGVELKEIGIESVFINLEGHETDYLETGMFTNFSNLNDFREWIVNDSILREFYE